MYKFASLLLPLAVAGCATSPIPSGNALPVPQERVLNAAFTRQDPARAAVTVKRDSGMMGSACAHRLFVDGSAIADLNPGERVTIYLAVGNHILGVRATGICGGGVSEVRASIASSADVQTFRTGAGQSGDLVISPTSF